MFISEMLSQVPRKFFSPLFVYGIVGVLTFCMFSAALQISKQHLRFMTIDVGLCILYNLYIHISPFAKK